MKNVPGFTASCLFGAVLALVGCRRPEEPVGKEPPGQEPPEARAEVKFEETPRSVTVENDKVKVVIDRTGGIIRSYAHKATGTEMVGARGALHDVLARQGYFRSDYKKSPYVVKVLQPSEEEVTVEMTGAGRSTAAGLKLTFFHFCKKLTLRSGETSLAVRYDPVLTDEWQSDGTEWLAPWLRVVYEAGGRPCTLFYPADGVVELAFKPGDANRELRRVEPTRAWQAVVSPGRAGLAVDTDYPLLERFNDYVAPGESVSINAMLRPVPLKKNESVSASFNLTPVVGFDRVDGVGGCTVGSIELGGESFAAAATVPVKARLYSGKRGKLSAVLAAKLLPAGAEVKIEERELDCGGDGSWTFEKDFSPPEPGTYAVYLRVERGGKVINDVRTFAVVGEPTAETTLKPYEEKVVFLTQEDKARAADRAKAKWWKPISIETPHVDWAAPLAGKRPKVLLLTAQFRQVAEIAQRLDMDWHTAPLGHKALEGEIAGNYDCICIGGLAWNQVPFREKILRKLEAGTGLVYTTPHGIDAELAKYLPVKAAKNRARTTAGGNAALAVLHPITAGVPFAMFPATGRVDYELAEGAQVLATIGEKPLAVAREVAGRRSVAISWPSHGGFLPRFSIDDYPDYDYHWWEGHYQLLIKAILWASHCEGPVAVTDLRPPGAIAAGEEEVKVVFREDFTRFERPWHGRAAPEKGLDGSQAVSGEPVGEHQRIGVWRGGDEPVFRTPGPPEETWLTLYYYAGKPKAFNIQLHFAMEEGKRQGWTLRIREPSVGRWTLYSAPLSSAEGADRKPAAGTGMVDMSIFIQNAPAEELFAIDNYLVTLGRPTEALARAGGKRRALSAIKRGEKAHLGLALENRGPAGKFLLESVWRDRHGKVWHKDRSSREVAKGAGEMALPVPEGAPGGANSVDVFLRRDEKVADFVSAVFEVLPTVRVTKLEIDAPKDYYLPRHSVAVRVESESEGGGEVAVSIVDTWGRAVERATVPAGAPQKVSLPLGRAFTKQVCVVAEAFADGVSQHDVRTPIYIRQPTHATDEFRYTICLTFPTEYHYMRDLFGLMRDELGMLGGWITRPWAKQNLMRAHIRNNYGVLPIEYHFPHSSNHNWMERNYYPRVKKWGETHDTRWLWRCPLRPCDQHGFPTGDFKPVADIDYSKWKPEQWSRGDTYHCLNDEGYLDWVRRRLDYIMKPIAKYDPWLYDLGDEMSFTTYKKEFDFDFSPKALAAFREWLKTEYESLADLNSTWQTSFKTWDEVTPFWAEKVRARKASPGKQKSYAPWVDHRTFSNITYNRFIEMTWKTMRKYDPDACTGIGGSQTAAPYGGWDWWLVMNHFTWTEPYISGTTGEMMRSWNTPDKRVRVNPGSSDKWHSLLEGFPGSLQWVDTHFINPDYSLKAAGEQMRRRMKEIYRDGYGTLFLKASHVNDPVAIHYSHATVSMDYIAGGNVRASRTAWVSLVEDTAMQLEYVSYEQLERGHLTFPRFKLFIMPSTSALSDGECAETKKWVEAGGVLVTDTNTGRWDEHGAPREKGFLEEYFGIDSAKAAEKQVGKGWVVHLARDIHGYNQARKSAPAEYREMLRGMLRRAGISPRATVTEAEKPALMTETFYHRLGGIDYISVRAGSQKLAVRFPKKTHVYELRGRKYLGLTDAAEIETEPTLPALFSLLPYQATALRVLAPGAANAGSDLVLLVAVKAQAAATGTHVIRFKFFDPDGHERAYYARTVLGKKGTGGCVLPLAFNEQKGKWTVEVLDLSTGLTARAQFEVK